MMNSNQAGSNQPLQWLRLPRILSAYLAFAVLATAWGHFGITQVPRLYEKTVPYTGWSGFSVYPFTIIFVALTILTPMRSTGRKSVVGLLALGAIFGVWDTYENTWGSWAGRDDYSNPYLIYSPWRPLITVAVPLFWAALLISPPMNRSVKSVGRFHTPPDALFIRLMGLFMPS